MGLPFLDRALDRIAALVRRRDVRRHATRRLEATLAARRA